MRRPRFIGAAAVLVIAGASAAADDCAQPARVYLETWNLLWHEDYDDSVTVSIHGVGGSQMFTFAATTAPEDIAFFFNAFGEYLGLHAAVFNSEFVEVVAKGTGENDFVGITQFVMIDGVPIACAEPDVSTCSNHIVAYTQQGTPGDLDCDGVVGVADLLLLLAAWGECAARKDCPADLSGDGQVGVEDLLVLLGHWG